MERKDCGLFKDIISVLTRKK